MNRKVFKCELPFREGAFELWLSAGAKFLKFASQYGKPTLWFEVDPSSPVVCYKFYFAHTGSDLPKAGLEYVGTELFEQDSYVLHLYRVIQ